MMKGMVKMKRNIRKSVQFFESEWKAVQQKAQECGMKPSTYLRNIAINGAVNVYDAAEFSRIRQHISCLVSNINQIAKVANSTGSVYENDISIMQETCRVISACMDNLSKAIRTPKAVI